MATREELLIIRAARAGHASAQVALGKRYLFGGSGLPRSPATALYWLDRAATQHERDAWMLIGSYVPFEIARHATQLSRLRTWYEKAFDAGMVQAGLVFAKLVLQSDQALLDPALRQKALKALEAAAQAGLADAQWLLAQHIGAAQNASDAGANANQEAGSASSAAPLTPASDNTTLTWTARAAEGGVQQAQQALADHAWSVDDYPAFLRWALPLVRELLCAPGALEIRARRLHAEEVLLLSRCAQALSRSGSFDVNEKADEIERCWELAASAGDRHAQFHLGLWFARMDGDGRRITNISGAANYKKSLRWLNMAGEQGMAQAWYAMSKIYLKSECSQRDVQTAQRHLEMAAEGGHAAAQLELGMSAWRNRRDAPSNDVRAVYWLLKAAAQGNADASGLLEKTAPPIAVPAWAHAAQRCLTRDLCNLHPFLAARIDLAVLFGLSRCEALLLDLNAADCGHCLVIDIRAQRPRSKRRLIVMRTATQRQALDGIMRLFQNVDSGPDGPEGNYRQRLYRLKSLESCSLRRMG